MRTGLADPPHETEEFLALIEDTGIRYVFVRAGPIFPSGEIPHLPSAFFSELQRCGPNTVYLPWLTGDSEQLDLSSAA